MSGCTSIKVQQKQQQQQIKFQILHQNRQVAWLCLKLLALFHLHFKLDNDIFQVNSWSIQATFYTGNNRISEDIFLSHSNLLFRFLIVKRPTIIYLFHVMVTPPSVESQKIEAFKQSLILVCERVCHCLFTCGSSKEKLNTFTRVDTCLNFVHLYLVCERGCVSSCNKCRSAKLDAKVTWQWISNSSSWLLLERWDVWRYNSGYAQSNCCKEHKRFSFILPSDISPSFANHFNHLWSQI